MILRSSAYPVAAIRACEQLLLDAQPEPDHLMRQAAHAVAVAAAALLTDTEEPEICVLVGAGGNGGDALYSGAELAASHSVHAILLGREGRVHERALAAFEAAGGFVVRHLPRRPAGDLIIDGILGIGGSGGLSPELGDWLHRARQDRIPVLAVDVPSGVDADTGALPEHHVTADVTVTFGALRHAHAVSNACGEVLIADIGLDGEMLSAALLREQAQGRTTVTLTYRALEPTRDWPYPLHTLLPVAAAAAVDSVEPGAGDDKYSGGVVGLCAGSDAYPGAAVLTTLGAVRATSAMVRYVGDLGREVVRAVPEVVISETVADTGQVQAWVVGPGRGTGPEARAELRELLDRPEPLLIDADAITLLAGSPLLRTALRARGGPTLLTPHAGEFRRLAASLAMQVPEVAADPLGAVRALADDLRCAVLLKGRRTVVYDGEDLWSVDAGSSWAATPGSGDVLAGITGAWIARSGLPALRAVAHVHAVAARLSAQTPDGPAPTSASRIAEAVPQATARLTGGCRKAENRATHEG